MSDHTPVVTVYGIHGSDGRIRYVGITTKPAEKRLRGHWYGSRGAEGSSQTPLHVWMRTQQRADIKIKELETCSWEDRHAREQAWTEELKTSTVDGGFNERVGMKYSAAMIAKRSETRRGWTLPQEARDAISRKLTGRKPSDEARAAISAALKGKPQSEARQRNIKALHDHPDFEVRRKAAVQKSLHVRWHVNRGITKPGCPYC